MNGEVNIGRRRIARMRQVHAQLPDVQGRREAWDRKEGIPARYAHLFRVGYSISGFGPAGGNSARLLPSSNATIDALVADIDAARDHVHLLFYIWLPDNNGRKVVEALMRAAARGVTCRAMADNLGSRLMIRSTHWRAMATAGVRLARALPIGNPLLRALRGRIDLRNHRSARRGVETTVIFPARNDSWIVGAASRSDYGELLDAGVRIFEHGGGLLRLLSRPNGGKAPQIIRNFGEMAMNRGLPHRATILFAALVLPGCMTAYQHNAEYQAWLKTMDAKCRYTTIPFYSPEAEQEFLELAYQGYYGVIDAAQFANRMMIEYPSHRLAINCMASSFPRQR